MLFQQVFPLLCFALFVAPFSWVSLVQNFSGSLQEFSHIVEEDEDMASEYGSDEGEEPASPTHPDSDFFSQVAQPGSTPAIISTAHMASIPLPDSHTPSRTSSSNTVHNTRADNKPYSKKAAPGKACSKPASAVLSRSGSPIPARLPIIASDWDKFMELLNNW